MSPSETSGLDLWTYEAMLFHWSEAQSGGDDIEPPDPQAVQVLLDRINADPRFTH